MGMEFIVGLNVLNKLMHYGLDEHKCDEIECISYNVNLDYLVNLVDKYSQLNKIKIYGNSEKCYCDKNNLEFITNLFNDGSIEFFHITENSYIIHSKIFRFLKNNEVQFCAIQCGFCWDQKTGGRNMN